MHEEKYWDLISRYLADKLSLEETEELLQWLDDDPARAALFAELQETWDKSRNYPEHFSVDTHVAWQQIKQKITSAGPEKIKTAPRWFPWIAAAASLFLVLGIGFAMYFGKARMIEITAGAAERKQVILPDGSEIWLNQFSTLTYAADFNESPVREVKLQGEAFFEVKKNPAKPFVIEAGRTITQVLGTSFDVMQDRSGNVRVAVVTGRVSFRPKEKPKQAVILLPGDEGILTKEGYIDKARYKNKNFLYWKSRELHFENIFFSEVIKTMEEAYHVKFYVKDSGLLQRKITTSFNRISLEEAADILEELLDIQIKNSASVYVVEKKKQ